MISAAIIALWFSTWAGHSTPDHQRIADAMIKKGVTSEGEARLVAAVIIRESGARASIWGDGHHSACAMQIWVGSNQARGNALNANIDACISAGVDAMRVSIATCKPGDELGLYASGKCGTRYGARISRDRMALAQSFIVPVSDADEAD